MSTNRINPSPAETPAADEGDVIAQLKLTSKISEFLAVDVIVKSAELFKTAFETDGKRAEPTEVLAGAPSELESRTAVKLLMVGAYCVHAQEDGKTDLPLNEYIDQCLTAKYPSAMELIKIMVPVCETEDQMMSTVSVAAKIAGFGGEKMNTIAAALPFYSVACVMFDRQNGKPC